MSDILIKNIQLDKPYTDIRIMPDGTYYPFKCFDHEDGEYEVLPDHGDLIDAQEFVRATEEERQKMLKMDIPEELKKHYFFCMGGAMEKASMQPVVLPKSGS